jgi:zinc/manganese transport system permease protein
MDQTISFLVAPFLMCLILIGIHCYLGLHVLERGVIFVDLSLAQVAALGATIALLYDFDHHSPWAYFISLGSTFLAAGLFAVARKFEKQFPQEAVIGIVYAMATAAVILVVDRLAHGAEHIKESLIGQILWVDWHDITKTAIIYSVVAIIHFIFRIQFLNSSRNYKDHTTFFWDFLFYALFGVIITSSVSVAGVLMVFSFLIVPAILSTLFFSTVRGRLIFGWVVGAILSAAGLLLSFKWNVPAGALIVVLFTSLPVAALLFLYFISLIKPQFVKAILGLESRKPGVQHQ